MLSVRFWPFVCISGDTPGSGIPVCLVVLVRLKDADLLTLTYEVKVEDTQIVDHDDELEAQVRMAEAVSNFNNLYT